MINYDEWHSQLEVDYDVDTPWHNFFDSIKNELDFENARILEIGCGRGGFANYFLDLYSNKIKEYVAIDYSAEAVRKAEFFIGSKYKNIKFSTGDIQNIYYSDNSFDYVFSFETIEHVPKPHVAVNELYRVLKHGGKLVLTTPNYFGFFGLYRIALRLKGKRWTEVGQPINKFVMMPLTYYWLRKAKFKKIKAMSEIISCPSPFSNKVIQFKWKKPKFLLNWFGLQSFFTAQK